MVRSVTKRRPSHLSPRPVPLWFQRVFVLTALLGMMFNTPTNYDSHPTTKNHIRDMPSHWLPSNSYSHRLIHEILRGDDTPPEFLNGFFVRQNPWTHFDPEGLATEQDYKNDQTKATNWFAGAQKDHAGDANQLKKDKATYDKWMAADKKGIEGIEATAKKWNNAAKTEVVKASELDDSWGSYKTLSSTDPAAFLKLAGATAQIYKDMIAKDPSLEQALQQAGATTGISPDLILSILTMEGRGWVPTVGLGPKELISELLKTKFGLNPQGMKNVSVGPGQLKGPARDAAGLTVDQANTLPGAFKGTATWLSPVNPQVQPGYSDGQRASVYNGGAIGGPGYKAGGQAYGVEATTVEQNDFPGH